MISISAQFHQALRHTLVLTATALLMIFLWAYLHLPEADLPVVVFAFLAAVRLSTVATMELRWRVLSGMLISAVIMQYIVSVTGNLPFLNVLLPSLASWILLKKLSASSAYPVLLTGFLTYSAVPGVYGAAERSADLLISGLAAWIVSGIGAKKIPAVGNTGQPMPSPKAFLKAVTIFCAAFLYKLLNMPQGIWILLTIIFIYMSQKPGEQTNSLVRQRIFSVPAGILLGGLYSGTVVMFDYRLVYLTPFIGAIGFFMLYYKHDFFYFTLFFMFAFTVCADWMSGALREFNFMQFLFARSLATLIGAGVLLIIEKSATVLSYKVEAS